AGTRKGTARIRLAKARLWLRAPGRWIAGAVQRDVSRRPSGRLRNATCCLRAPSDAPCTGGLRGRGSRGPSSTCSGRCPIANSLVPIDIPDAEPARPRRGPAAARPEHRTRRAPARARATCTCLQQASTTTMRCVLSYTLLVRKRDLAFVPTLL